MLQLSYTFGITSARRILPPMLPYPPLQPARLLLKPSSNDYNKTGFSPPHLLLGERANCGLIIRLMLTNLKDNGVPQFFAWDGTVIFDCPRSLKIDSTTDRTDREKSKVACVVREDRGQALADHASDLTVLS